MSHTKLRLSDTVPVPQRRTLTASRRSKDAPFWLHLYRCTAALPSPALRFCTFWVEPRCTAWAGRKWVVLVPRRLCLDRLHHQRLLLHFLHVHALSPLFVRSRRISLGYRYLDSTHIPALCGRRRGPFMKPTRLGFFFSCTTPSRTPSRPLLPAAPLRTNLHYATSVSTCTTFRRTYFCARSHFKAKSCHSGSVDAIPPPLFGHHTTTCVTYATGTTVSTTIFSDEGLAHYICLSPPRWTAHW